MIEYTAPNNTKMRLQAYCDWTIGILILQEWTKADQSIIIQEIQLQPDQAEKLIEELKAAIAEHRKIDASYDEYQRKEEKNGIRESNTV